MRGNKLGIISLFAILVVVTVPFGLARPSLPTIPGAADSQLANKIDFSSPSVPTLPAAANSQIANMLGPDSSSDPGTGTLEPTGSEPGGESGLDLGTGSEGITVPEESIIVTVAGQELPLEKYQTYGSNALWIEGTQGWTQYTSVPQYSDMSLIVYTPTGGQGAIYEMYPNQGYQGSYTINIYNFSPGYNRLGFRGNIPGRHILSLSMNKQSRIPINLPPALASKVLNTANSIYCYGFFYYLGIERSKCKARGV